MKSLGKMRIGLSQNRKKDDFQILASRGKEYLFQAGLSDLSPAGD
jgi:hypothetical protein